VAIAVAIAASARAGDDDDDLAAGDGTRSAAPIAGAVLVARDATWQVQWATAPALTVAFGPSALAALDRVRGGPAAPPLWGPSDAGPPVGWPFAVDGDVGGRLAIDGGVLPRPAPDGRIAAAWAVTRFTLDAGAADTRALRVLELRVRYRDGLAAWLNGVPIARRELTAAAPALAIATRPHGPEWESFFVPVAPGLLHAGTNVLAIEARPAAHGAAPALEVELAGRPQARVVRGPMVQRVGADRATIVLETDLPTVATVAWGQAALDHALPATAAARRHELALTGLPADALVRYQVTVDGAPIAAAAFATTPAAGEVVRIGVYGDVRGGHRVHAQLVERLVAEAPDLVVASGDLVLRGTDDADWQQFFAVTAPLLATVPYYPAVGNHDLGRTGDLARRVTDQFALPPGPADRPPGAGWYSFDVADVHLVMLDSNAYDDARQRAWLEADLRAADAARAIVVVTHDGPYARGTHGGNQQAVRDYVPILVRHRATLVISGHDHIYQRGAQDGLPYLVSGGGGAPLYRLRCGVRGRPRCARPDGMVAGMAEHHYAIVSVYPAHVEVCPRRVDGAPLEPCWRLPTRR
jgi:hypothetical protein